MRGLWEQTMHCSSCDKDTVHGTDNSVFALVRYWTCDECGSTQTED